MAKNYYKNFRVKLKDTFDFTRSEIRGIILLLSIIILIIIVLSILIVNNNKFVIKEEKQNENILAFLKEQQYLQDSIKEHQKNKKNSISYENYLYSNNYNSKTILQPFDFCPDTMQINDWKRLGFKDNDANQIYKYLSKRGHIQQKEDLLKIYCIDKEIFNQLYDYIQIKENYFSTSQTKNSNTQKSNLYDFSLELNSCDSFDLQIIPGIGSKISARIIAYRNKLGGFYQVEQLKEVYGIDSLKYEQIKKYFIVNQNLIKKININTATVKTLSKHPYIEAFAAKAIVNYRQKNGNYTNISDVKKAVRFYDELFNNLQHYFTVNE